MIKSSTYIMTLIFSGTIMSFMPALIFLPVWFELSVVRFCFFFQAEDGIRDVAVTGVQTCALPISTEAESKNHDSAMIDSGVLQYRSWRNHDSWTRLRWRVGRARNAASPHLSFRDQAIAVLLRWERGAESEERSVPPRQGRHHSFHAGQRPHLPDGHSGDHRHATIQHVPKRVHDLSR